MSSEALSTPGEHYRSAGTDGSCDRIPSDYNEDNICPQTGEEFAAEFYRDRFGLRRQPVTTDVDNRQLNRLGFDLNQNYQLGYEDFARVLAVRRMDSDTNSDLSDFALATAYVAEPENRAYPNNLNRSQGECGSFGQRSAESPQSSYPCQAAFPEAYSFKKIKFLCSFGGRILPRPNDGKLRYVGGETRIISIEKNNTWKQLMEKTNAICNQNHIIKYQLPGEDLDALISVCSDEDLHHMIEEYEELERIEGSQRLRIFLISLNEPESPNSMEARVSQPGDVDYQYVVAVNGMLPSPRKSSSGQSLASHSSQFGNTSDFNSPRFFKEPPTTAFAWDMKDYSPRSPCLGGLLSRPGGPQFLTPLQVPGRSFTQSNPTSPMPRIYAQPNDPQICNVELFVDQPCNVVNESLIPLVTERIQCDNSLYRDNANYVDPISYCKNLTQGPPFQNYYLNNQHIVEATQPKNPSDDVQFHTRSHSDDYASSAMFGQIDMIFERPTRANEGSYHFDESVPHPEGPSLSISVSKSNNRDKEGSHCRLLHAFSDPLLQKSGEIFEYHLQPCHRVNRKRPPLPEILNSFHERPLQQGEIIDRKDQETKHLMMPSFGMTESRKGILDPIQESVLCAGNKNASSDETRRYFEGNIEVTSHDNVLGIKGLEHINYQQGACLASPKLQSSQRNLCASSLNFESKRNLEQPHDLQLDTAATKFFMKSQNSTMYNQSFMLETEDSQSLPLGLSDLQLVDTETDTESILLVSNTDTGAASKGETFLPDENPANCFHQKNEETVINQDSYVGHSNELCDQSLSSVGCQEIMMPESLAVVKGPTASVSSGIQSFSKIVLDVIEEIESQSASPEREETESVSSEPQSELAKDDNTNSKKLIGPENPEIEAEIYGLQIIKNADIEERRELGSGTFGTVYHGKWRGTDVAIKRIKSSCFSGRVSEQERLTKDFWREAKILSTLHHPNVVAFYGVVPDGPDGTLATVTEYMVHGSLRNVLLKKDKVLDRRRRLMIAMDAAFGMEYLHLRNIVHFDLKCDNLLVNLGDPERPICKVGDFGLSRIKCNTFVSGGVRGTLPWMAPELLDGSSTGVSEKVDVFSFGIAMWEILTGEEPYANLHCGAIIGGIVSNTLRPVIPKRCDSEWKKLMEQCWSPDPEARPTFTEITHRFRTMQVALQKKRHNAAH